MLGLSRILLELIRIILIFFILGGLMGAIVKLIYSGFGINVENAVGGWLVGFSILTLLFVLYRNKLQFSGFIKGTVEAKLPKKVGFSLIFCSVIMLIAAPFFH